MIREKFKFNMDNTVKSVSDLNYYYNLSNRLEKSVLAIMNNNKVELKMLYENGIFETETELLDLAKEQNNGSYQYLIDLRKELRGDFI